MLVAPKTSIHGINLQLITNEYTKFEHAQIFVLFNFCTECIRHHGHTEQNDPGMRLHFKNLYNPIWCYVNNDTHDGGRP